MPDQVQRYRVLPCALAAPEGLTYSIHRSAPDSALVRRSDGAIGRLDAYSGRLRGDLATDPAALAALQSYLDGERS